MCSLYSQKCQKLAAKCEANSKMPKQKSDVWNFFGAANQGGKNGFKCNYCNMFYIKNATRQEKHLRTCTRSPITVKNKFLEKQTIQTELIERSQSDTMIRTTVERSDIQNQSTLFSMRTFVDSLKPGEQERLNLLLAKAIYASDAAFSMLNNEYWREFFKELRPCWKIPSHYMLSNSLLEAEYERMQQDVHTQIVNSDVLGLECDGWSNRRNEPIVNFVLFNVDKPLLYKTIPTGDNRHTGEYLAELMSEVIEEVGPNKIFALVTDNDAAMIKAREIIQRQYPHLEVYSCAAHTLNLLVKDIVEMQSFKLLTNNAKDVVKCVNSSHVVKAIFEKIQERLKSEELAETGKANKSSTVSLKLPGKTRWGSMDFCVESLTLNKKALKTLAITKNVTLKAEVKQNILDEDFWCGLASLHAFLLPIVKWITILEGDSCTLSRVSEAFQEIETCFEAVIADSPTSLEDDDSIRRSLQKRRQMTLGPIHFAANILDPKCNGMHLRAEEQVIGNSIINDRVKYLFGEETDAAQEVMTQLADYRDKKDIFSLDYVRRTENSLDARTWWRSNFFGSKMSTVASQILNMPATSAATERTFSRAGNVQNVKRNRMTTSRAGTLTYVSHTLKLAKRKKARNQKRIQFSTDDDNDDVAERECDEQDDIESDFSEISDEEN